MSLNIIPQPNKAIEKDVVCAPGKVTADPRFGAAAAAYDEYVKKLDIKKGETPVNVIYADNIDKEGYAINCGENVINVFASDLCGANNGLATLLQLAYYGNGKFKAVDIEDSPDCKYRGLMIDAARIWHPLEYLKRYVDLCRYYKFSYLHIHFTDSQSYTLPCKPFPGLPTPGKSYSVSEIKELNDYAYARGIKIMPEIDVPGHCDPFLKAYPDLFGHDGIIGFHKKVFDAFELIISDLCEMFPYSDRIHIGGDEADIRKWLGCEDCREYAAECGIPVDSDERLSSERILAKFVAKLSDIVLSHGKTPVVWEGFCKDVNYLVPHTTEVFSWENYYQTTPELIEEGYTIINGKWSPNYIVSPKVMWSVKECFDWDVNTYRPVHPASPYIGSTLKVPFYDKTIGGQLLSWGDFGAVSDHPRRHIITEFRDVAIRAAATAENTWNIRKRTSFDEFEKSLEVHNRATHMIFNYTELKTDHLILRPFSVCDMDDAHEYCDSLAYEEYEEFDPNYTETFVKKCIEYSGDTDRSCYNFAIVLDGKVIGGCDLRVDNDLLTADAGWFIHKDYQNKGYATEAAKKMISYGFEYLGLHRVTAHCHVNNIRSRRVMEKIGMRREALYRSDHKYKGNKWGDSYGYAVLREEYDG